MNNLDFQYQILSLKVLICFIQKLGAYYAAHKYNVEDDEICSAIQWHTTGKPAMTLLEKIVFIADYIEPYRNKAANLDDIRHMAFTDIDMAAYVMIRRHPFVYKKNWS